MPKAKAAQLKLEHFYKVAVDAAIERNTRYVAGILNTDVRAYNDIDDAVLQTCRAGTEDRR